jgi:hypothetical protein
MYFLYVYEYGTLKPVKVILRRERGKREKNGGNESTLGTIHVEMPQ